MERPDRIQRELVFSDPVKKLVTGPCISQPGVPIPDSGCEEFNIGFGSPRASCGNQVGDPSRATYLAEKMYLLAQEFKLIGSRLCWLCMNGFPERWIIILRGVVEKFPTSASGQQDRGPAASFKFPSSVSPNQVA
jgi:hypothetical protein